MNNNNNNNNNYIKTTIKAKKSQYGKAIDVGIKNYIFIGYEHTDNIKDYIAKEYWGMLNKRLFYHINYTFRARLLNNEIYKFELKNGDIIGLFHTGLRSKKDNSLLYLIFKPNPEVRKQLWTLPVDAKNVDTYMMTKNEVIKKYNISSNELPKVPDYFEKRYIFNPNYTLILDWDIALRMLLNHKTGGNSKQVILKEFEKNGIKLNSNVMRQELIEPLTYAVDEALQNYKSNNDYIRPGIFFLDDGYKIVHQMLLNVEYPRNSGKLTKFVAVFEENKYRKEYKFKKLLNLEMAYKNARLVGQVPQSWTFNEELKQEKKRKKFNISPININAEQINFRNNNNNNNNNNNYSYNNNYNNNSNYNHNNNSNFNNNINNNNNNKYRNNNIGNINNNNLSNINHLNYLSDISSIYTSSNVSTYVDSKQKQNAIPPFALNDAYSSPFSLDSNKSFPNMTESKSNSLNVPKLPTLPTVSNNNNVKTGNNINYIGMKNNSFPKTFKKQRFRTLTLINDTNVVESLNEITLETSNIYSQPVKQARAFGYFLNNLDANTRTQLMVSRQIKITSEHYIYQISNENNIESIEETRMFNTGASLTTLKTYLNVISSKDGSITTTEFPGLNSNNILNNSNNNSVIINNINNSNSNSTVNSVSINNNNNNNSNKNYNILVTNSKQK